MLSLRRASFCDDSGISGQMGRDGWRAALFASLIFLLVGATAAAVAVLTDGLVRYFAYVVWYGALVALVPWAYPPSERLRHGAWAFVGAFFFAPAAVAWLSWLAVTRGRWVSQTAV